MSGPLMVQRECHSDRLPFSTQLTSSEEVSADLPPVGPAIDGASMLSSQDCDQIDFHRSSLGELGNADGRPGRLVGPEVLGVDGVQRLKICEVCEVDGSLGHVREI